MSESSTRRIVSSHLLKLVAGGVSLLALALLAVLAAGLFGDDPEPTPVQQDAIPTSQASTRGENGPALAAPDSPATSAASSGNAALHAAIEKADSEAVHVLLDGGADANAENWFGDPALHVAIDEDHTKILRFLVEAGANVDAKNAFGDPALHRAILKEDSEMVRILVEAGANVDATNAFGDSALSRAVHKGDSEILRILTGSGVS